MRDLALERFGPFGDEENLRALAADVDIARGKFSREQVIGGDSHRGVPDSTGAWFGHRATFLLRNQGRKPRVVFEVYIDPTKGAHPAASSS